MDQQPEKVSTSVNQINTSVPRVATRERKALLMMGVAAIVLLAGLWIWKSVEINQVRKKAEMEKQAIKVAAKNQLMQAHDLHLQLLAKPMIWALRTEMMQGNIGQVNLYLSDMVKEKNIQRVLIADTKGKVVASTNKKDEGQLFSSIESGTELNISTTMIKNTKDSVLTMTSPIMGFNNRLGTFLIRYSVPQKQL
jgi:hypothetical protein